MAITRFKTSTHQATRLRATRAPARTATANAHAKLVSGKLNRYLSMNSRGTFVRCRINGDTLDSSDAVAMTPRNQPAAAGTQWNRERVPLVVSVIGRQTIPLTRRAWRAR